MLERLEKGMCFYCAAEHVVPGWEPGLPKPPRAYRMCAGHQRRGEPDPCRCVCLKIIEFTPMRGYSTRGRWKGL